MPELCVTVQFPPEPEAEPTGHAGEGDWGAVGLSLVGQKVTGELLVTNLKQVSQKRGNILKRKTFLT